MLIRNVKEKKRAKETTSGCFLKKKTDQLSNTCIARRGANRQVCEYERIPGDFFFAIHTFKLKQFYFKFGARRIEIELNLMLKDSQLS